MAKSYEKNIVESILRNAGLTINGKNPYDPQIHNDNFYSRVIKYGSMGLGESYVEGWWDCEKLDEFFNHLLQTKVKQEFSIPWRLIPFIFLSRVIKNPQNIKRAFEVGKKHYDIGNDLYRAMLDKRLTYTCGYWKGTSNLDEAQEAKLDLICRKLGLKAGQTVLDIGCGWGSFMKYASEKYGVKVVGITVSKEQADLAEKLCAGLPVEIRLQDYRLINEKFDHIVSIGMFEHVGYKNYKTYMEVANRCLKDGGLFLLHTIGGNRSLKHTDPWIDKYIFPNGMIPSIKQIGESFEELFVMEDWHNFGADYDKTLMAWFQNFENSWGNLKSEYSDKFYRMWKYYLLSCAGAFRARDIQLWQIVLSKHGVKGGYKSVR